MKTMSEAAVLRALARNAEKIETFLATVPEPKVFHGTTDVMQEPYTCNAVEAALGSDAKRRYREMLVQYYDEQPLWNDPDFPSIRVLLLCFAAAMAETGDL